MSHALRLLFEEGLVTRDEMDRALVLEARRGETATFHLVATGAISDDELAEFMARRFSCPRWPRYAIENVPREVASLISPALAAEFRVLPLALSGRNLTVGITDPSRTRALEEVAFHTGCFVVPAVVSEWDMSYALEKHFGVKAPDAYDDGATLVGGGAPIPLTTQRASDFSGYRAPAAAGVEDLRPIPLIRLSEPRPEPPRPEIRTRTTRQDLPALGSRLSQSPGGRPAGKLGADRPTLKPAPPAPVDSWADIDRMSRPAPSWSGAPAAGGEQGKVRAAAVVEVGRKEKRITAERRAPAAQTAPADATAQPRRVPPTRTTLPPPAAGQRHPAAKTEANAEKSEPRTEGEIIVAIEKASDRDEIVKLGMAYLLRFASRAVFFAVKKGEIRGFDIAGEFTNRDAIKSFWLPLSSPSTLKSVAESRQIHVGPLGHTPADSVLTAALGGRPARVLLVPVAIGERVAGLLYADGLEVGTPPLDRLRRLAEAVGAGLERLVAPAGVQR